MVQDNLPTADGKVRFESGKGWCCPAPGSNSVA